MGHRQPNLSSIVSVILAAALFAPVQTFAQGGPPAMLPQGITSSTSPPSSEQQALITSYANYWTGILSSASSKPEEIEAARARLVQPATSIGVSQLFLMFYADAIAPALEAAVTDGSIHAGVNAMVVAGQIGTDKSINFLTKHADQLSQDKWQLRLQAAFGCVTVMKGNTLEVRKMHQVAGNLRNAALAEDHPLILRHHLAAIDAADHNPLEPADRERIRQTLANTLAEFVERIAQDPKLQTPAMVAAVSESVRSFRDKVASGTINAVEQRTLGRTIGPVIGGLLEITLANWQTGQADATQKRAFSNMIGGWEGFLPTLDRAVRAAAPATPQLRRAWDSGDQNAFKTEVEKWSAIFSQPPYGQ